jgi:hypothetical protein
LPQPGKREEKHTKKGKYARSVFVPGARGNAFGFFSRDADELSV